MRYKVIKGSQTGHCCFKATIVDTYTPHKVYTGKYQQMCECFNLQDANKIADALNAADVAPLEDEDWDIFDGEWEQLFDALDDPDYYGPDPGAYDGWQDDF